MTIGYMPLRTLSRTFSTGTFMTIGICTPVKSRQLRGVPSGPPSSVMTWPSSLSYGVRMGSRVFDAVCRRLKILEPHPTIILPLTYTR